jgi:hypothetical protein
MEGKEQTPQEVRGKLGTDGGFFLNNTGPGSAASVLLLHSRVWGQEYHVPLFGRLRFLWLFL